MVFNLPLSIRCIPFPIADPPIISVNIARLTNIGVGVITCSGFVASLRKYARDKLGSSMCTEIFSLFSLRIDRADNAIISGVDQFIPHVKIKLIGVWIMLSPFIQAIEFCNSVMMGF